METRAIRTLTLYFDAVDEAAAELIGRACARSLDLIRNLWGLEVPEVCRVYVMTSWVRFLFHSAPWPWRIYLAITLPLRYAHIKKVWDIAGGWALRYGRRRVIGIKPPRLLQQVDAPLGERIFNPRAMDEAVAHNTCHELVHACSDHLKLPNWLHEGLAMVTVDRFAGNPTVKLETLETVAGRSQGTRPPEGYGRFASDPDSLLYLATRGYWITRYLAETRPGMLRELLTRGQSHEALESTLAAEFGMSREAFWRQIDGIVVAHFSSVAAVRGGPPTTGERPSSTDGHEEIGLRRF
jgi:hypothetical protein